LSISPVENLAVRTKGKQTEVRVWKHILRGGLVGLGVGVCVGPIGVLCSMWYLNYMYGAKFMGLEVLAGPVVGGIVGIIE
jgi:hypothetical protein